MSIRGWKHRTRVMLENQQGIYLRDVRRYRDGRNFLIAFCDHLLEPDGTLVKPVTWAVLGWTTEYEFVVSYEKGERLRFPSERREEIEANGRVHA